jgi:hypothetical protein
MYGELLPLGGGDPIPLLKTTLLVGRRESADIVLRFPNVTEERLKPGDKLSIAKHEYEISFDPIRLGGAAETEEKSELESIFGRSLLESAGLEVKPRPSRSRRNEL